MTETTVSPNIASELLEKIRRLPCWQAPPEAIEPLSGGITNQNFLVSAAGARYVVRIGGDIPVNHVMRFNEQAASRAAAQLGLSPQVRHTEADVLVMDYVPSTALKADQVGGRLPGILALMRSVHQDMMLRLRGPAMSYWIFHVIRDNLHTLKAQNFDADLPALAQQNDALEACFEAINLVYCHNDWLPANILDDGKRLWLIDWDYAGFNSPLSDLASLATNNQLPPEQESWLLENYYRRPVDTRLQREFLAMKAAALLKETLWSMCSQCFSTIDFDYAAYSRTNLARYEAAWADFQA